MKCVEIVPHSCNPGTFVKAMLNGSDHCNVADRALRRETHLYKPDSNNDASVRSNPDEASHSSRSPGMPNLKEEIPALDRGEAFESKDVCKGGLNVEGSQPQEVALLAFIAKEIGGLDDPHLWPGPITGIQRERGNPSRLKYPDGDYIA
jgi:hypothetical protein